MSILNYGSINIDIRFYVDEIVKPGQTIIAERREIGCGGKGLNQSIALARAGAKVYHAGKVGKDAKDLVDMMQNCGINIDGIYTSDDVNGYAMIQVDKNGENSIIVYGGSNREIQKTEIDEVLSHFSNSDYLLLQNEINNIGYIIRAAHKRGMKIAINAAPITPEIANYPLELVDYLIINETEGFGISGKKEPDDIIAELSERYPKCAIILTLGSKGVVVYSKGKKTALPSFDVKAVDSTGAGDTFIGYFLTEVERGKSAEDAAIFASKASALSVMKKGASEAIPTRKEVEEAEFNFRK